MSAETGRTLWGFVLFGVGLALLLWPPRVRGLGRWLLIQRVSGLAFMAMGAALAYPAFTTDAPSVGGYTLGRLGLLAAAVVWLIVGGATFGWPERVRSLTNPEWEQFGTFARAGSSLISYRLTGLGFILMSVFMIHVLLARL
jgi:hypothetical protein